MQYKFEDEFIQLQNFLLHKFKIYRYYKSFVFWTCRNEILLISTYYFVLNLPSISSRPIILNHACALHRFAGILWIGTFVEDLHPGTQHRITIFFKQKLKISLNICYNIKYIKIYYYVGIYMHAIICTIVSNYNNYTSVSCII